MCFSSSIFFLSYYVAPSSATLRVGLAVGWMSGRNVTWTWNQQAIWLRAEKSFDSLFFMHAMILCDSGLFVCSWRQWFFFFVDDSICYRWADYIQCHCLRGGNRRCCDINRLQEGRIFRSKMFRSSNCQSLLSGHQLSVDIAGEKGISLHDFYCIAFFSMEIIKISECIVTHVHQYKVGHYACVTMYG